MKEKDQHDKIVNSLKRAKKRGISEEEFIKELSLAVIKTCMQSGGGEIGGEEQLAFHNITFLLLSTLSFLDGSAEEATTTTRAFGAALYGMGLGSIEAQDINKAINDTLESLSKGEIHHGGSTPHLSRWFSSLD